MVVSELEAAYHTRKEKGKKVLRLSKDTNTKRLSDNLPALDLNLNNADKKDKKIRQVKHRSIPKAKTRKKNM